MTVTALRSCRDLTASAAAVLALALLAPAPAPAAAEPIGDPIAGRRIAEARCAECHAIHTYQEVSPELRAPHFSVIANGPGATAADLQAWLRSSHPEMPGVLLEPQEASDVIEYLLSMRDW